MTLQNMLHSPVYAGIYAYGRRRVDPRRQLPGRPSTGRVVRAEQEWLVAIPGVLPAYITVEAYHANLARLAANAARAETPGVARAGWALRAAHDGALPPPCPGHRPRVCVRSAADRLRPRRALPGPGRRLRRRAGHQAGPGRPDPGRGRGLPARGRAGDRRAGRAGAALATATGACRDRGGSGAALLSAGRAGE